MISSYEEFKQCIKFINNNLKLIDKINLIFIPKEWWTSEIINQIIFDENEPGYYILSRLFWDVYKNKLQNVPYKFRNERICKVAVNTHYYNLKYVPHILRTKELCKEACKYDIFAFDYIPNYLKVYSFHKELLEENIFLMSVFEKKYKTKELCEIAVTKYGYNLQYVPMELRTEELCNIAIKDIPEAEQFAPKGTSAYNNYMMKKALL